jgi:hypothetical protein
MGSYDRHTRKMISFQTKDECTSKDLTSNLVGYSAAKTSAPAGSWVAEIVSYTQTLINIKILNITKVQGRCYHSLNSLSVFRSSGHAFKIPMLIERPRRHLLAIDSFQVLDNSL